MTYIKHKGEYICFLSPEFIKKYQKKKICFTENTEIVKENFDNKIVLDDLKKITIENPVCNGCF